MIRIRTYVGCLAGLLCVCLWLGGSIPFEQTQRGHVRIAEAKTTARTLTMVEIVPRYIIDNKPLSVSSADRGYMYQQRIYVPLRFVGEALQKQVTWNGATATVQFRSRPAAPNSSVSSGSNQNASTPSNLRKPVTVRATFAPIKFVVDGKPAQTTANQTPFLIAGKVYVPLRDVAGLFAKQVTWDGRTFTVRIANKNMDASANRPPTAIRLSTSTISENQAVGTIIGTFSTIDPDSSDRFTYSFVSGNGATDNKLFSLNGARLKSGASFDFEKKSTYSIRVQAKDRVGKSVSAAFTIRVGNQVETMTVILDARGGAVSPVQLLKREGAVYGKAADGRTDERLPVPNRNGYLFQGWKLTAVGDGLEIGDSTSITQSANHTLYAQWKALTYSITFIGNGHTDGSVPAVMRGDYGSTLTLPGNSGMLTRPGFVFSGWNTRADGAGLDFAGDGTFTIDAGDVTLFAKWTAITETVIYNGNSNTGGVVPTSQSGSLNSTIAVAGNPGGLVRAGYTFTGWNTKADGSGQAYKQGDPLIIDSANLTLYAQWSVNVYRLTYNGNGHTGGAVPAAQTGEFNTNLTLFGNIGLLVRTGYTFAGWNTQADGKGANFGTTAVYRMGASDATLYARWVANTYIVSYVGNGQTGGSAPVAQSGVMGSTLVIASNTGSLVRTGYAFNGWNTQADGSGTSFAAGSGFTFAATNVTMFAQWQLVTYTLSYNGNGQTGGNAPQEQSGTIGQTILLAGNSGSLVRSGYLFNGWNTRADGTGTNYNPGTNFVFGTANINLFARWLLDESGSTPVEVKYQTIIGSTEKKLSSLQTKCKADLTALYEKYQATEDFELQKQYLSEGVTTLNGCDLQFNLVMSNLTNQLLNIGYFPEATVATYRNEYESIKQRAMDDLLKG